MFHTIIHTWLRIPYKLRIYAMRRVRKPQLTILFLHGIGNTGAVWDDTISRLPDTVRYVAFDLLGFGSSPKPHDAEYDAATQARAIWRTYRQLRMRGKVVIVGHSLGGLIAVEMARRYPRLVDSLILCSPPFYTRKKTKLPQQDTILKDIYRQVRKHPEQFVALMGMAKKYRLISNVFDINDKNIHAYIGALETSIVNQNSLAHAYELSLPIYIIHGRFDPVVVTARLTRLEKARSNVRLKHIIASHDITPRYAQVIATEVRQVLSEREKQQPA